MSAISEIDACMTANGVGATLLDAKRKEEAEAAEAAKAAKIADLNASRLNPDEASSSDGRRKGRKAKKSVRIPVLPDPEAPSHDDLRNHFGDTILMVDGVDVLTYLESGFRFNNSGIHPILCGMIVRSMYEAYWKANGFEGYLNYAECYETLLSAYDFFYNSTGSTGNYANHLLTEFTISGTDPLNRDVLSLVMEDYSILNKVVASFLNWTRNKFDCIDLTLDERNIVRVKLFSTYTGDREVTEPGKALNDKARKEFLARMESRNKPAESGSVRITDKNFYRFAKANGAIGPRTGLTLREQAREVRTLYGNLKKYNPCITYLADHLGKIKRFHERQQKRQ